MTIDSNKDMISLILAIASLVGVCFAIYKSYHKPQEDIDKKEGLLSQKVEFERCANERKFKEFADRLDQVFSLAQNHIHTVDTKVDGIAKQMGEMSNEITKLSTIIDERIPKKS